MGSGTPIAQGTPALSPDANPQNNAPLQNLALAPPPGQEFNVPDERLVTQTASELGIPDFDRGEFIFSPDLGISEAQQRELFDLSANTFVPIFRDIAPPPPPQEDDIIFDAFNPPSQPLPLIDFNEAVAQQQIQAGNIAAALQDQTGRSNPILDAILRGRERSQAERQRRIDQTGSPTGGLTQVADASKFSKFLGDAGQAIKKGFTAAVTPGSSDFLRLNTINPNSKASPTNTIPGVSFTGQGDSRFGRDTLRERQVPLSQNEIEQAVQARNRGVSKPFVTNRQIISNLGSPVTGKGGEKPRRSVFDVLFNSDPLPPVPSATVQIPLEIRDKLLDDEQGRARGGLVGLIRKGN